jgi:membrane protease YdiL (CAAX protease family)
LEERETDLGQFPIALMAIVLLVPIVYCVVWKRESLRRTIALWLLSVAIVALYPVVIFAFQHAGDFGYFLAKFVFFVLLPVALLMFIEGWSAKTVMINVGVRRKNLERSIAYGLLAAIAVIAVTVGIRLIIGSTSSSIDASWSVAMFLDAFTEEFLWRGVFFLYLMTLIDWRVAAGTSIVGFVLMHSQYIGSLFIVATITQAVLLTWVTYKTKNIIGPWISHGLSRIAPQLVIEWIR